MRTHGFTLIELLIIIAIIGVLASLVFPSMLGMRERGKDDAIFSTMDALRIDAELYKRSASGNGDYQHLCTDAHNTDNDRFHADLARLDELATQGSPSCRVTGGGANYSVLVPLNQGDFYCIDSDGFDGVRTQSNQPGGLCPGS